MQEIASNGPRFGGSYYADTWYFRGHANSDWPLVPNVFRETTMLMLGEWSRGTAKSNLKQIALEARLLLSLQHWRTGPAFLYQATQLRFAKS